ncbi:hypothetical protein EYF80_044910 [Liparis tanakae]|uniref:Uncharacterized protein n=1 Tax=Liparis tanakae TaxID=230148 RepID=A0A4Z2FVK7_9TELE|nr:hypothetical protein EYF80_044910 [Liparis tanakae]
MRWTPVLHPRHDSLCIVVAKERWRYASATEESGVSDETQGTGDERKKRLLSPELGGERRLSVETFRAEQNREGGDNDCLVCSGGGEHAESAIERFPTPEPAASQLVHDQRRES